MSKLSHTPGPWVMRTQPGKKVLIRPKRSNRVGMATIAFLHGDYEDTTKEYETRLANARLIALAPEMKEELIAAKDMIEDMRSLAYNACQDFWDCYSKEEYDSVVAAITRIDTLLAKIEGTE